MSAERKERGRERTNRGVQNAGEKDGEDGEAEEERIAEASLVEMGDAPT